ncbi:GxxExxY protein [Candidatus Sumerlaeota bacterium]|nr:GxxExxY protein [Candidatus Sumerlaeota bacterium]MBI3736460.1 GxxExxY protein [Candidatus Sumerlaeota bacterium]
MAKSFEKIPERIEILAAIIIDAALKVHKALGPGLLESVYVKCLVHELKERGLKVLTEVRIPLNYDGMVIEEGLRLDILVENEIIIEVKAVEELHPIHKMQLLTYLRLSGKRLGLLINFNVPLIKDGIVRVVN